MIHDTPTHTLEDRSPCKKKDTGSELLGECLGEWLYTSPFFFLILSAVEFAVGLVIMLLQHTLTRSVSLSDNDMNAVKFSTRLTNNININRLN
jgi:hypothetical protein